MKFQKLILVLVIYIGFVWFVLLTKLATIRSIVEKNGSNEGRVNGKDNKLSTQETLCFQSPSTFLGAAHIFTQASLIVFFTEH